MTANECIRRMRQDFLAGKHRFAGLYMPSWALEDACLGDVDLATECMARLDDVTPRGWTFEQYVDDTRFEDGELVCRYLRTTAEVAHVMARACDRSSNPCMRALSIQGIATEEIR